MGLIIMIKLIKKHFNKTKIYICLALIILSAVILPINVFAYKDKDFFSGNDILFYDPDAKDCLNSGVDPGDGTLTGKNNKEKIWCYLITVFKLSPKGAAGVMGNIMRETGNTWKPDLWQGTTCEQLGKSSPYCGYGLAQWSDPGFKNVQASSSQKTLWGFAGNEKFPDTSGNVSDLKTQLDYLLYTFNWPYFKSFKGEGILKILQNPNITPEDAADNYLNAYGLGWGYDVNDCGKDYDPGCQGRKNAGDLYTELKDLPCGNAAPASPSPEPQASGTKPKILISPGHTGMNDKKMSGNPPIIDWIYGSDPELQDDWDVGQKVKTALIEKGYEVLMTKNSVDGGTFSWNRAKQANDNKVDLAFEIHTDGSNPLWKFGDGEVYSQSADGYRKSGESGDGEIVHMAASPSVMSKSQDYAKKFANARKQAGEPRVQGLVGAGNFFGVRSAVPYSNPAPVPAGNMPLVMLWSEVPWIYNEAGTNSDGKLTESQKTIYAEGLVNGVVASVPPGTGATKDDGCNSSPTGSGDASAIVEWALKLSWDDWKGNHGNMDARPLYIEWQDKIMGKGQSYGYAACNVFVSTVMRASGADSKYPTTVVSNPLAGSQLDYIQKHPDLYEKVDNPSDTGKLEPGDILIVIDKHTGIYVGNQAYGNTRESAFNQHVPGADTVSWYSSYGTLVVYRLK